MCGIIAYVGNNLKLPKNLQNPTKNQGLDIVLKGLKRLEYRGYDSAGVAALTNNGLQFRKKSGKLKNLLTNLQENPLQNTQTIIGHTRWATHGKPIDANAHPHLADQNKLALVHNGIIENFVELKKQLPNQTFLSETDTEVVAKILAQQYRKHCDMTKALQKTCQQLEGTFTLLAIHEDYPETVFAARKNSPLIIGLGENENFLSSDVSGFLEYTKNALELEQNQIVQVTPNQIIITDFQGNPTQGKPYTVAWDLSAAEKNGHSSFMIKEIYEQPTAIKNTLRARITKQNTLDLSEIKIDKTFLQTINKITIIACGTAAYSGEIAKYVFEKLCHITTTVEMSHEFRYRNPILDKNTLVIAVSQSGETMDTLMAMRYAKQQGVKVLAICNTLGSSIPQEADFVFYTHAGPEIAVASTKAFLAQIVATNLFALHLAQTLQKTDNTEITQIVTDLTNIPQKIQQVIDNNKTKIQQTVQNLAATKSVIFLGRHLSYPVALEGALKLKEIAYIHAEGFAAGELKHGPIALISAGQPVFVILPSLTTQPVLHSKMLSTIQEIRARGAYTLIITEENDTSIADIADITFFVPKTHPLLSPLLTTVPLQLFACELAKTLGLNIDKPRNLAKSVTVE